MTRLWRRWKCSETTLSALPWCNKSPSSVKSTTPTRSAFFWGPRRPVSSTFCKLLSLGFYQNPRMAAQGSTAASLPPKISKKTRYVTPLIEGTSNSTCNSHSWYLNPELSDPVSNCELRRSSIQVLESKFKCRSYRRFEWRIWSRWHSRSSQLCYLS